MPQSLQLTRTVGRGMLWSFSSTMLLKILGVISIFLILRELGPYEYGIVELVLSVVPLCSIFLLPALQPTIVADVVRERRAGNSAHAAKILSNYFFLQSIFAVLIWAALYYGANLVAAFYPETVPGLFKITAFFFLLSPFRTLLSTIQAIELRYSSQSAASLIEEVSKLVAVGLFFMQSNLTPGTLIMSILLSQIVPLVFFAPSLITVLTSFLRCRFDPLDVVRHHAKWGLVGNYVGTCTQVVRIWLVKAFLGTEAVGLFAAASGLVGHVSSLFPLSKVVAPIMPRYLSEPRKFSELVGKSMKYQFVGLLVPSVILGIVLPVVLPYFFPKYIPALGLFQAMLLILLPSSVDAVLTPAFIALRAQKDLFFASLYKLLLTLILFPAAMVLFGLYGAAVGFFLVNLLYAFERFRKFKRLFPVFSIGWRETFSIDEIDKLLLYRALSIFRRRTA